jgi:hypothetical protein
MSFSNGFSFSNLNLASIEAAKAAVVLAPGRYVCKTVSAELTDSKSGGKLIKVRLEDVKGKGLITGYLNVHVPKSDEATRIGLEQLKALLVHGGHSDPDNVGDHGVASIKGLTVGVIIASETYEGEKRSKVTGFCPPSEVKGYEDTEAAKSGSVTDGDIPF